MPSSTLIILIIELKINISARIFSKYTESHESYVTKRWHGRRRRRRRKSKRGRRRRRLKPPETVWTPNRRWCHNLKFGNIWHLRLSSGIDFFSGRTRRSRALRERCRGAAGQRDDCRKGSSSNRSTRSGESHESSVLHSDSYRSRFRAVPVAVSFVSSSSVQIGVRALGPRERQRRRRWQ